MKKGNKTVLIVLLISGFLLITIGVSYKLTYSKKSETNKPTPSVKPSVEPPITEKEDGIITKEIALNTIKNIYDIDNLTIKFKEEVNDFYIFEQQNSDDVVFNTFKFNKKTGQIIQEESYNTVPNY